ncbi:HPP family protein [Marinitoga litoralis]|uniref:CBS domain-containing protein n=1 Tax=Marinitoga litoralis TaxID=570855 RepID=UPI0019615C22|nr:CBS domain-containing protein [Marinitoga litoralis]MBM7559123.1 CBS domain-containing protein [Marinitoga litoralis]
MKVEDIMLKDVTSIVEDVTVERFITLCERHGYSALPIVDKDFHLVGLLSESMVIKASIPGYLSLMQSTSFIPDSQQFIKGLKHILHEPVSKIMDKNPTKVYYDDTALYVADVIIKKSLKIVPVVDHNNRLVGIVRRIKLLSLTAKGILEKP